MMKRIASALLCAFLLCSLFPAALGSGTPTVAVLKIGVNRMALGEEVIPVDPQDPEVCPIAENNRTLMPVSRIAAAFGGSSTWDAATNDTVYTLGDRQVAHTIFTDTVTVYPGGETKVMEVPSKAMHNRTYMPMRYLLEGLGLWVGYEPTQQLVVVADSPLDGVDLLALPQSQLLLGALAPKGDPIALKSQSFALPSGSVSANVVTVDVTDPRVKVRAVLPDGLLNNTRSFSDICAASGARVVVNGNFFDANMAVKDPIGHVMGGGEVLYGVSGLSALAFTSDHRALVARPGLFFRVETVDDGKYLWWDGFEVNDMKQADGTAVIYTPARGAAFPVTCAGFAYTVVNGVTSSYQPVAAGDWVAIPADGYVLYLTTAVTQTGWFCTPEIGRQVSLAPYVVQDNGEPVEFEKVTDMVSGAPRLVKGGAIWTEITESGFAGESRFSARYSAPRTGAGVTADGKLVLASVSAATVQQMRELMFALGCVDAINLDGGGSVAMYVDGKTLATPGRQLTTTLQIWVE